MTPQQQRVAIAKKTSETRAELSARLHNALFGACCGYDLESTKTLTPDIIANARRLQLLSALKRLRNDKFWPKA